MVSRSTVLVRCTMRALLDRAANARQAKDKRKNNGPRGRIRSANPAAYAGLNPLHDKHLFGMGVPAAPFRHAKTG